MRKEFHQLVWDHLIEDDCRPLIRLAVREDLDRTYDWTTVALVPAESQGQATIVARRAGVLAGLPAIPLVIDELEADVQWQPQLEDGQLVQPGTHVGLLRGSVRDLLVAERLILNLIGRLSGVASLTQEYVRQVQGCRARIYDTRKTTPGYRRLEKYAVRCGGGWNHRTGLYEAVLIKDNHLAFGRTDQATHFSPAEAVLTARHFLEQTLSPEETQAMIVEIEVDCLEQLDNVLPTRPDIVLLDNMTTQELAEAVRRRDAAHPEVELEASGGVDLHTVRAIAEAGVDRISVGALTHSAMALDLALDWSAS